MTVSESPDSRQDTASARDLGKIMVAAWIHNHSFGLKLWRVVGVVLMLTQSGCDVKDNRIKKRRLRARRECVAHQFIAEAPGRGHDEENEPARGVGGASRRNALHAVRGAVRSEGCIRAGRDGRRAVGLIHSPSSRLERLGYLL